MYDRAAICTRGSGAMLNFLREEYDDDDLPNGWVASEKQLLSVLSRFKRNADYWSFR